MSKYWLVTMEFIIAFTFLLISRNNGLEIQYFSLALSFLIMMHALCLSIVNK